MCLPQGCHEVICRFQVQPLHNFSFSICPWISLCFCNSVILFSWRGKTSLFSSVIPIFIFSSFIFQDVLLKCSHDHNSDLLLISGFFVHSSLLSTSQQCRILMKALRNSMLKVVYMMGLTALFRYPSQVTALYSEGEMQQLLQWAFSTWVRKKGNQQMINTPLKQKKKVDQKFQPAKYLGCDKI